MEEDRHILYSIRAALAGNHVAVAQEIALSIDGVTEDNVRDFLISLNTAVNTLQNTAFNSGRSFIRFNDGFTIDRNNIATYEDKNIIYTAKNDKMLTTDTRPDVNLPNDTEIQASGEQYPITFEFTHLGGTATFQDRNILRLFLDGVEIGRLLREQVAVVTKEAPGEDYVIQSSTFDPNQTILPNGVFNLKTDTHV
nr:hypothetical protein [Gammaproteobacteria bacterium]